MAYSLLWALQDLYHQPYERVFFKDSQVSLLNDTLVRAKEPLGHGVFPKAPGGIPREHFRVIFKRGLARVLLSLEWLLGSESPLENSV